MKNNAIKHMNEEHGDIVEAMAIKFGSLQNAKNAKIVDIDEDGLDIDVDGNLIRVPFAKKANQNGEGYKDAIMEICKDLKPSGDKLVKISAQLIEFIDSNNSVIISSLKNGMPFSSYAPAMRKDDEILALISSVAPHYKNLISNPDKVSILFLQDESKVNTIFARIRASWEAKANFDKNSQLREFFFDEITKKFPQDQAANFIREMSDFEVIRFSLTNGRFVRGFGAAYDMVGFKILSQADGVNPHNMPHKHGK
ncbi:DUF2470 domain-containing protein [Campylobacter porcelli]|uniref:DUF2470 domain-containing protein n=1 Tax=Campylobacter porcelli TaxID=1660073 RepID=A0ABU7M3D9_9BACT|nr:DUF2470 domain-containing protein [Campylobacter sp. CX2-4855-23]